ncbi:MAG: exosortase A [Thalassotalea sp.]
MEDNNTNNRIFHSIFLFLLAIWFGAYQNVLIDMVSVWNGSETYTYCFLILPIVLYLVHEKQAQISSIPFQFNAYFCVVLFLGQCGYLLFDLAGIGLLTHLAAYGSLICLVGAVYGWQLFKFLSFPLFFLIFSVPMGEELVPALQEVTADISVFLVEQMGIPVYREGLYIYIPNGTFEVAEACSGIRFLISMIAIGTLYAYLFYQSPVRRTVFTLISIVLPIIANGFRAFGIIYIGHTTNMEHAVGADHLVYGWVFFSIVLLLLMLIGKLWREDTVNQKNKSSILTGDNKAFSLYVVVFPLLILLFQPAYNAFVVGSKSSHASDNKLHVILDKLQENAATIESVTWLPTFNSADATYSYRQAVNNVELETFIAQYNKDDREQELINSGNRLFDIELFSIVQGKDITVETKNGKIDGTLLNIVSLSGTPKQLFYWFQVGEIKSSNKLAIKKAQLFDKLSGGSGAGLAVIMSFSETSMSAEQVQTFFSGIEWL